MSGDLDGKQATNSGIIPLTAHCFPSVSQSVLIPVDRRLPVLRGRVARFGLGLIGGRWTVRSCVVARFLLALDRLSRGFLPVSGSFWINFFSTYFDRIHDSLSPLRDRNDNERVREMRIIYISTAISSRKQDNF